MIDDASYVCPSCGEEIVVPIDPCCGREQEYGEDCPVCCCPLVLTVRLDGDDDDNGDGDGATVTARAE